MLRGLAYDAFIVAVLLATLLPPFLIARSHVRFRFPLAYVVGFACGALLLAIELHMANGIWWAEFICVLLLPLVGATGGVLWRWKYG
jgi:hypothetical protein